MKSNISIKHWKLTDAEFISKVRNIPELMKWFKQDQPVSLEQQKDFMLSPEGTKYGGMVIRYKRKPVGVCNIKKSSEFGIALLPEYQGKGIGTFVVNHMKATNSNIWSNVFVMNPALKFYLNNGFKAFKVREREYYKKHYGWVDTVYIRCTL